MSVWRTLAAIDRSRRHVQDDRPRFDIDELLQSALLQGVEIIGEVTRGVSDQVGVAHPEVPWRVITDKRNRVSRGYFDIDLDVVWNTVTRLAETSGICHPDPCRAGPGSRRLTISAFRPGAGGWGPWTRELTSTDYARIADLVNSYEQLPLGVTDVSDAAIAEPLGLTGGRH